MTTEDATLFDYAQERDRVLAQVAENVGETFLAAAKDFVLRYLEGRTGHEAPGEEITDACKSAGIVPARDDRAFGPVYQSLARAGRIKRMGYCLRKKGHGTAGGIIWRLSDTGEMATL